MIINKKIKRLLLPLLALLALPNAVNAEAVYLESKFEKYEPLIELGIKPNTDQGIVRSISNSIGEKIYKANQSIKYDSYSLKANATVSIDTYTVSRIDGSATKYTEMKEKYKKIFHEMAAVIIRNGSCKKKEKVETLF